jgi:hypothetical protein
MRTKPLNALLVVLAVGGGILAYHPNANAQPGRSDFHVKATATATKPDADGKQTVTITLDIEKGFYLFANPVNHEFLEEAKLTVKVTGMEKVKFDVKYPAGKTTGPKDLRFDIYEGVVKIDAKVVRTNGDTSPLTIQVRIQAQDRSTSYIESTIKLTVPLATTTRSIP